MQDLLLLVLSAFVMEYGPVLILMEDVQFFDTVSLQLLADFTITKLSGCLIIASRRPDSGIFNPKNNSQACFSTYPPADFQSAEHSSGIDSKGTFCTSLG